MSYNTACLCEYIGSAYCGWQRQKNGVAVQDIIEQILSPIYGENIKIAGSGRTDAGVHALGLVFSYKSVKYRTPSEVMRALNSLLPDDIAVTDAAEAPENFHAGKSAISKTYIYKIGNSPIRSAFYKDRVLWIRKPIDLSQLNLSLSFLEGSNDFTSFCVAKTKKPDTVRTVNFAKAEKKGDVIEIEINANGFLHNMVRIIAGTCLNIVLKGRDPEEIKEILACRDRRKAGVTAPAYALYQKEVFYNNKMVPGLKGIGI